MAVSKQPLEGIMELELQTGLNAAGNPVLVIRRFSNVKPDAADQDVYDAAQVLAALQKYTLSAVTRVDYAQLVNA